MLLGVTHAAVFGSCIGAGGSEKISFKCLGLGAHSWLSLSFHVVSIHLSSIGSLHVVGAF